MQAVEVYQEAATAAQVGYIKGLIRKGLISNVDAAALTKEEASALITGVEKQRSVDGRASGKPQNKSFEVDRERLHVCVRIVCGEVNYALENSSHQQMFKRSVKALYKLLSELEGEISEELGGD